MTETTWHRVGRALLGRWPSQVTAWGEEGIAAYVQELQADGLTADDALVGLRSYRPGNGRDFPPSVAVVSKLARWDPSEPTFDEALTLIRKALRAYNKPLRGDYGTEAKMFEARERNVLVWAEELTHPLVAAFISRHGVERLIDEVGELDGQYGAVRRNELEAAWEAHCEALEGRRVAGLVSSRRGELGRFDPLAVLGQARQGTIER